MTRLRGVVLMLALALGIAAAYPSGTTAIYAGHPQVPPPNWSLKINTFVVNRDTGLQEAATCTGTMIAVDWAITAAHCVKGNDPAELSVSIGGDRLNTWGILFYFVYPDFDPATAWTNDVALIYFGRRNMPVSWLPLASAADVRALRAQGVTAFGFGRTSFDGSGPMSDVLMKTPDGAWVLKTCPKASKPAGGGLGGSGPSNASIALRGANCYEYAGIGGEIKSGDSGGPWVGWRNGGWRILGVVSGPARSEHGVDTGGLTWQASVDVSRPAIADWIRRTMNSQPPY